MNKKLEHKATQKINEYVQWVASLLMKEIQIE